MITETKTNQQIAETILSQLGGRRFVAMTGARDFVFGDRVLTFRVGRNAKSVTHVEIRLNSLDLYDVRFLGVRGASVKVKAEAEHIYADMLRELFERETGLYTRL